jgi:cytochrome c oxidase cbb3-type subunit III
MQDKDRLLESHQDNDGIQEYDNPLPNWFLSLFYGCVVFAMLYFAYYTGNGWVLARAGGVGQNLSLSGSEYLAEVHAEERLELASKPKEIGGGELIEFLSNPASIEGGKSVFAANCLACHGAQGQGVVGPNLTDEYWLHGGNPEAILASVTHGYPDKGMPGWKPVLGEQKVRLVTAFVYSLRGAKVANGKAPQGEKEP